MSKKKGKAKHQKQSTTDKKNNGAVYAVSTIAPSSQAKTHKETKANNSSSATLARTNTGSEVAEQIDSAGVTSAEKGIKNADTNQTSSADSSGKSKIDIEQHSEVKANNSSSATITRTETGSEVAEQIDSAGVDSAKKLINNADTNQTSSADSSGKSKTDIEQLIESAKAAELIKEDGDSYYFVDRTVCEYGFNKIDATKRSSAFIDKLLNHIQQCYSCLYVWYSIGANLKSSLKSFKDDYCTGIEEISTKREERDCKQSKEGEGPTEKEDAIGVSLGEVKYEVSLHIHCIDSLENKPVSKVLFDTVGVTIDNTKSTPEITIDYNESFKKEVSNESVKEIPDSIKKDLGQFSQWFKSMANKSKVVEALLQAANSELAKHYEERNQICQSESKENARINLSLMPICIYVNRVSQVYTLVFTREKDIVKLPITYNYNSSKDSFFDRQKIICGENGVEFVKAEDVIKNAVSLSELHNNKIKLVIAKKLTDISKKSNESDSATESTTETKYTEECVLTINNPIHAEQKKYYAVEVFDKNKKPSGLYLLNDFITNDTVYKGGKYYRKIDLVDSVVSDKKCLAKDLEEKYIIKEGDKDITKIKVYTGLDKCDYTERKCARCGQTFFAKEDDYNKYKESHKLKNVTTDELHFCDLCLSDVIDGGVILLQGAMSYLLKSDSTDLAVCECCDKIILKVESRRCIVCGKILCETCFPNDAQMCTVCSKTQKIPTSKQWNLLKRYVGRKANIQSYTLVEKKNDDDEDLKMLYLYENNNTKSKILTFIYSETGHYIVKVNEIGKKRMAPSFLIKN